jgi:hypothetical protein
MHLDISFAEINKLLAAKGLSWLEIGGKGEDIIISAKGARLKLRQIEPKLNSITFSHKGDNMFGKVVSGAGAGIVSLLKVKLPKFLSMDSDQITVSWKKLIPQLSILETHVNVKKSGLQVEFRILPMLP